MALVGNPEARLEKVNYVVVTEEFYAENSQTRIPNICRAVGMDCTNLLGMFRREGWTF